jgi:hypothetical protein
MEQNNLQKQIDLLRTEVATLKKLLHLMQRQLEKVAVSNRRIKAGNTTNTNALTHIARTLRKDD